MPRTYESQVVDQQLGTGVDEDTDPRYSNKPDIIENAHYARSMQLSKRNGTRQIAQDGGFLADWGAPTALGNLNRQLTHARSGSAFSLTDKLDTDGLRTWVRSGPISRFKVEEFNVLAPVTYPPTMAALAVGGTTYRFVAAGRLMILDQNQRLIDACEDITGPTVGGIVTRQLALAWENGGKFVFLYDELSSAKLFLGFSTDQTSFPTTVASTAIITDLNDTAVPELRFWDACIVGDNLYIIYLNKAGVDRVTIKRYDLSTLAFTATVSLGAAADNIRMVSITADANWVYPIMGYSVPSLTVGTVSVAIAEVDASLIVFQPFNDVITETFLSLAVPVGLGGSVVYNGYAYHTYQTTYGTRMSKCLAISEVASADLAGHIPLSRPFVMNGSIYQVLLAHRLAPGFSDLVETGATSVLVEWTPQGTELVPQLHGIIGPVDSPAYKSAISSTNPIYPRGVQNSFTGQLATIVADEQVEWAGVFGSYSELTLRRAAIVRMTRDTQTTMLVDGPDEASALISGGAVYAYDGTNTFPVAFTKAPAVKLFATGSGTGNLTAGGKYFFAAVFRGTDSKGNVYRSEVSVPVQVTMGATDTTATITVTNYGVWQHQYLVGGLFQYYSVELYRSVAGGATLFLDQTISITSTLDTTATFQLQSTLSDTEISQRPSLYTFNGIKSQQPAKGAECIFFSGERAWCITATGEVYHSGFIISGDGFKFNLDFLLPPFGNDLAIAGGDLDGTPVIFRQREIWMVLGEGPDDSGIGNFTLRRVAADTGCDNPKSVVLTPDGLEFTYQNRMYILTRQGQLQRVSDSIQNTLAAGSVLAATRVPEQNEVRFLQGEQDDASQAVVQDLRVGTVQNPVFYTYRWDWDLGEADAGYATGAVLFEDQYTLITSQGNTFQDDPTTSLDASLVANKWVRYHVRGSWSKSAIQTFMRTWHGGIIYDRLSDCDIRVSIWNNYKPAETQFKTFASLVNATWTDNRAMLRLKTQRGFAVRIEVSDAPPNGVVASPGTGIALAGFSFEGQVQGGLTRLPKGQRG